MKYGNTENIIKYIIDNFLYEVLVNDVEIPNISFEFKEQEGLDIVNRIILDNIENRINEKTKIYDAINYIDYNKPVVEINNYKLFFTLLFDLVNTLHDEYNKKCLYDNNKTQLYFHLSLKYIWLRMTPDDYKNPEIFLRKNIEMIRNETFDKYFNKEGQLLKVDDNHQICYKNKFSSTFDEENKEIVFYIKNINGDIFYLPTVRYGIYEKDNKKICEIGSIQNKYLTNSIDFDIVNEYRKTLNRGVPGYLKQNVEPKKVLSLILFIKLLQENRIDEITIPTMYVLDYDFHNIWEKNNIDVFNSRWSDYLINLYPDEYEEEKEKFEKTINKVEFVCQNKSDNFIKLFERLMYHIPEIKITEYPGELSSFMTFTMPKDDVSDKLIKTLKKS